MTSRCQEGAIRQDEVNRYETALIELRKSLIRTLGMHSVDLIMRRAVREVSQTYPAMALITYDGDDIAFDGVRKAMNGHRDEEMSAAFSALNGVMLVIVARMLGREIAIRLAQSLDAEFILAGGRIASPAAK